MSPPVAWTPDLSGRRESSFALSGALASHPLIVTLSVPDGTPGRSGPWPCVVQVHGYTTHRDWGFMPLFAERLARLGIAAARLDFSSDGRDPDTGEIDVDVVGRATYRDELHDLAVLRDWLGARGEIDATRLGIVGHSRGGAMSLVHAAESQAAGRGYRAVSTWAAMDGIIRFSPERQERWRAQGWIDILHHSLGRRVSLQRSVLDDAEAHRSRLDVVGSAARLGCPLQVVHGRLDRAVEAPCAENLAQAGERGAGAELCWLDDAGHSFGARDPLREITPRLEGLMEASTRFFAARLG